MWYHISINIYSIVEFVDDGNSDSWFERIYEGFRIGDEVYFLGSFQRTSSSNSVGWSEKSAEAITVGNSEDWSKGIFIVGNAKGKSEAMTYRCESW